MGNNNDKIWDIANDDLVLISLSFEKIKATAISAHSYLNSVSCESSESTNTVLYMFSVIEDLANMADNSLNGIMDKLCAIYREAK